MIYVTVGTQLAFDRLIEAVDEWAQQRPQQDIFAQIGPAKYFPKHFPYADFLTPAASNEKIEAADFVIAHAGMGSILTALKFQKPLIIMPREASLGEHRNDHQLATANWVKSISGIFVVWSVEELKQVLNDSDSLMAGTTIGPYAEQRLLDFIGDFIDNG